MFDGLDPKIMLFTAAFFLIMLVILNAILYRPLLGFMHSREENALADEQKIRQSKLETNNNEALVSKILADARERAISLREEELGEAKSNAQRIIDAHKQELEEKYSQHLEILEQNKAAFKAALQEQMDVFSSSLDARLKQM